MIDIEKIKKQTKEAKENEQKFFEENVDLTPHFKKIEELMDIASKDGKNNIEYKADLSVDVRNKLVKDLMKQGIYVTPIFVDNKMFIHWPY